MALGETQRALAVSRCWARLSVCWWCRCHGAGRDSARAGGVGVEDSVRLCSVLLVPGSFERHLVGWPRVCWPNWLMRLDPLVVFKVADLCNCTASRKMFSTMVVRFFLRRLEPGGQTRTDWSSESSNFRRARKKLTVTNAISGMTAGGALLRLERAIEKPMLTVSLWKRSKFLHPLDSFRVGLVDLGCQHLWFLGAPNGGARFLRLLVVRGTPGRRAGFFFFLLHGAPPVTSFFIVLVDTPTWCAETS